MKQEEEEKWTAVRPRNKSNPEPIPALETAGGRSHSQLPHRTSEEVRGRLLYNQFLKDTRHNKVVSKACETTEFKVFSQGSNGFKCNLKTFLFG